VEQFSEVSASASSGHPAKECVEDVPIGVRHRQRAEEMIRVDIVKGRRCLHVVDDGHRHIVEPEIFVLRYTMGIGLGEIYGSNTAIIASPMASPAHGVFSSNSHPPFEGVLRCLSPLCFFN